MLEFQREWDGEGRGEGERDGEGGEEEEKEAKEKEEEGGDGDEDEVSRAFPVELAAVCVEVLTFVSMLGLHDGYDAEKFEHRSRDHRLR